MELETFSRLSSSASSSNPTATASSPPSASFSSSSSSSPSSSSASLFFPHFWAIQSHTLSVTSFALSLPDGSRCATGSEDGTIIVRSCNTGVVLHTLKESASGGAVAALAFAPGGARLASGCEDGTIVIWDVVGGSALTTLKGHLDRVSCVYFMPDARHLVSGSWDKSARIWDTATGKDIQRVRGHVKNVNATISTPDGARIITAGDEGIICVWDTETGINALEFKGHTDSVSCLAAIPNHNSEILSGSDDGRMLLWSFKSNTHIRQFQGHNAPITSIAVSLDGTVLASGGEDRTIRIWNKANGGEIARLDNAALGKSIALAFSPDISCLFSAEDTRTLTMWDLATNTKRISYAGHSARLASVLFSPDGKRVASAGGDKIVHLWDSYTGGLLRSFVGCEEEIFAIAFSQNSSFIAAACKDLTIRIWNIATSSQIHLLEGHAEAPLAVAFSPDSNFLATAGRDRALHIWELASGTVKMQMRGHTRAVTCIAYAPDSSVIASGSEDRTLRLWDPSTSSQVRVLEGHRGSVTSLAFSPNGSRVLSGSMDRTVRIWDAAIGVLLLLIEDHPAGVLGVSFASDGTRVVSAAEDGLIRIMDAVTGNRLITLQGHDGPVNSVAFSPDTRRIVSGGEDKTLRVWDTTTTARLSVLRRRADSVLAVKFSLDGTLIISGHEDKTVRIWDSSVGSQLRVFPTHSDAVRAIAISHDGSRIATGDTTARLWDAGTGTLVHTLEKFKARIFSINFSPDSLRLAIASDDKTIRIWDAVNGSQMRILRGHTEAVNCAVFSKGGSKIASASADTSVRIWDATSWGRIHTLKGHTRAVNSVSFSPDGLKLVSCSDDHTLRLWDALAGLELRVLEGHTYPVLSVCFSPDGRRMVSGSKDKMVRVWETHTGFRLKVIKGHTETVTSVDFSPDGSKVVSGSEDGSVCVWDSTAGTHIQTFEANTEQISAVAFSPDDRRIVSSDKNIQLLDTLSGRQLQLLKGHSAHIYSVAFDLEGKRLVSASHDDTVRVWETSSGAQVNLFPAAKNGRRASAIAGPEPLQADFDFLNEPSEVPIRPDPNTRVSFGATGTQVRSFPSSAEVGARPHVWDLHPPEPTLSKAAGGPGSHGSPTKSTAESIAQNAALGDLHMKKDSLSCDGRVSLALEDGVLVLTSTESPPAFQPVRVHGPLSEKIVCAAFAHTSPVLAFGCRDGNVYMQRWDDLVGACNSDRPTHFLPGWYIMNMIEEGGYLDELKTLLKRNPASLRWSELCNPEDLLVKYASEGRLDLLEFFFKLESRPFHLFAPILKAVVSSRVSHKVDVFTFLLQQLRKEVLRQIPTFIPEDPIIEALTLAAAEGNLRKPLREFLNTTPLLKAPSCVNHNFPETSIMFPKNGNMLVARSETQWEGGLWARTKLPSSGVADFSESLVTPFSHALRVTFPGRSSFLAALVHGDPNNPVEIGDAPDFFDNITVRTVLDFKWQAYGLRRFQLEFFVYMLGLIALVALSLLVIGSVELNLVERLSAADGRIIKLAAVISAAAVFIHLIRALYHEVVQAKRMKWLYLTDFWNCLDVLHVCLGFASVFSFCVGEKVTLILLSISVFLRWFGILYFLQAFEATGALVRMVLQIMKDMGWFLVLLAIGVLAAANAFYIILKTEPCDVNDANCSQRFSDPADALFMMFNMLILSAYEIDDVVRGPYSILLQVFFVIAMILVPIVLLNLLIALMSDSYEHIQDRSTQELLYLKATIILEQEQFMKGKELSRKDWFPRFIHVLVPRGQNMAKGGKVVIGQYQGVLNEMKGKIDDRVDVLEAKMTEMDKQITDMAQNMAEVHRILVESREFGKI